MRRTPERPSGDRPARTAATPKGRETRERIFDASIRLIAERGYEAATIPDICREAGISVGNFYHHFRSKSEILLEYVEEESDRLLAYYRGLESLSRREALLSSVERFFGFYARKGRNFVATFLSILLTEGREWFEPGSLSIQFVVRDCLERGAASGEFRGSADLGGFIGLASGLVWDLSCGWCVMGGPKGLASEARGRFERLLDLVMA